ncbi:MAG: hypothetical protein Q8P41_20410 [Pseudomonadota bacterium]|nr:hypothetical protein [Pseudomonadota bacterium]
MSALEAGRTETAARVAVVALCGLAAYNALYFFPITVDDAFISLRYAWNLAHGEGLVFNPGERVEGYSNPSWTLLAALFLKLGIEPLLALKWTGIACVTALPAVAWATSKRLGLPTLWALLPAALCAVDLNIAFWAPNGLEAPLWTLLLAAFPGLLARRWTEGERVPVSALVGAALYVTRPEAPLFILPAILVEAARALRDPSRRKAAFTWAAALAVPCLAWLGFRIAYYGDWVANTYYVKASDGFHPDIFKKYLASWLVVNAPMTGALLALSAPLALRTAGGRLAVAGLGIQLLFVLRAGGDWMAQNRFWGPAVPLAGYVIATGAHSLATLLVARGQALAPRVIVAAVVLPLLPQAWRHLTLEFLYLDNGKASVVSRWEGNSKRTMDRVQGAFRTGVPDRVARVLEYIPDGAVVAHSEIGLLAYVSDNPMVDAFGLVDRRLSGATGEGLADVIESFGERPPEYLLMRDQVPMLKMMTKTTWYAGLGYAERQRWQNVWLETPTATTGGKVDRLPPEQAFARLDRAVERVPRDITFHMARIDLARAVGDREREARYCAAAGDAIPALANLCKGGGGGAGGGAAPKADAIVFRPFVAQTPNLGFEALAEAGGKPDGWSPVPGDATGFEARSEGAAVGTQALVVTGNLWVCSDWAPVKGDLRISGKVRADNVTGAKNDRQGAAVNFRVRIAGQKKEDYPILKAWSGTTEWQDFALTWPAKPEYTEYRACVGLNNAQGAAWFDEVAAGTEDAPADSLVPTAVAPTAAAAP